MSATSTLMPAGFNSIAVRNAAMLKEALRRLPQMPSTLMPPASLISVLRWGWPGQGEPLTQPEGRDKAHAPGGSWRPGRRGHLLRRTHFLEFEQQQNVVGGL